MEVCGFATGAFKILNITKLNQHSATYHHTCQPRVSQARTCFQIALCHRLKARFKGFVRAQIDSIVFSISSSMVQALISVVRQGSGRHLQPRRNCHRLAFPIECQGEFVRWRTANTASRCQQQVPLHVIPFQPALDVVHFHITL